MRNEMVLYDSERTFRRVLSLLLSLYLVLVVLIQTAGESLRPRIPAPVSEEPLRVVKLLPTLQSPLPPPPEVKAPPPPFSPPSAEREPLPPLPPGGGSEPRSNEEKAAKKGENFPPPGSPAGRIGGGPSQEEVKKVGLLGLLGGKKGSSASPAKRFPSLKEIPPASAEKGPSGPFPPAERIETIRERTVGAEETRLAQTRRAAAGEDLSETRIFYEGGELNEAAVTDIVHQNREKLLVLYNRRLQKNPNVQGRVTVEFIISPKGEVLKCAILSSSLSDSALENEIVQEILRWKFPSVERGATTVLYPLSFFPAG